MSEHLGNNYHLDIEVLTPLHVGSGRKLLKDIDFAVRGGVTFRLNEDAILADRWPDDPALQSKFLGQPLAELLEPGHYQSHPQYFRYTLRGEPAMREIVECIRDVRGQPYLPGSSLKGALRTALLRAAADSAKVVFERSDFGPGGGPREAKQAAAKLEQEAFGYDPNHDIMRALEVGDSQPVPMAALTLQRIQMVPQLQIDAEAIARGTHLTAPLRVDTWLLERKGQGMDWSSHMRQIVSHVAQSAQFIAQKRIAHEYEYHSKRGDRQATSFYMHLAEQASGDGWPKNEFLVQVGFATGWRAKTVLGGLEDTDPLLEQVVHDFSLDRGGGKQSRGYTRGQPFPKARHLAWVGSNPALPMGWLRIQVKAT